MNKKEFINRRDAIKEGFRVRVDKEDFEIMSTKIAEADITEEEREELRQDLEDALYRYTELMEEEN